jgi:hypothetical protein
MDKIEQSFWQFHKENPSVYTRLRDLALTLKAKGWKHYGIGSLFEVLRYHRSLETTDPIFKLNNNHRALYARLLMRDDPRLADFFELRKRSPRGTQHYEPETGSVSELAQ